MLSRRLCHTKIHGSRHLVPIADSTSRSNAMTTRSIACVRWHENSWFVYTVNGINTRTAETRPQRQATVGVQRDISLTGDIGSGERVRLDSCNVDCCRDLLFNKGGCHDDLTRTASIYARPSSHFRTGSRRYRPEISRIRLKYKSPASRQGPTTDVGVSTAGRKQCRFSSPSNSSFDSVPFLAPWHVPNLLAGRIVKSSTGNRRWSFAGDKPSGGRRW